MKKTLVLILSSIFLLTTVAHAAVYDGVSFNRDTNEVTVTGNLSPVIAGDTVTVYMLKGDKDEVAEDGSAVVYISTIGVNNFEAYTHTFSFDGDTGKYVIGASDSNGNRSYEVIDYYSNDEMNIFAKGTVSMSDSEIKSGLALYAQSLNIPSEILDSTRDTEIILDYIKANKNSLEKDGLDALTGIVEDALYDCELIHDIEACEYWYEIEKLITDNLDVIGVSESKWNSATNRTTVCSSFLNTTITNISALAEDINGGLTGNDTPSSTPSKPSKKNPGSGGSFSLNDPYTMQDIAAAQSAGFTDIDTVSWAAEAILALSKDGVINGVGGNLFNPNAPVKREELAKMLVLAFDIAPASQAKIFDDVAQDSWYAQYVSALCDSGISTGMSDSIYGTGVNVSRQDIAVFLYRIMTGRGYKFTSDGAVFDDAADIDSYAKQAVSYMTAEGIINGMGDGRFAPADNATRAQAAKLIYEVKNTLIKGE